MTKNQFLDAVNEIDDEFINEIINIPDEPQKIYFADDEPQAVYLTNKPIAFWKIAVSAAAAICVLTAGIFAAAKLHGIQTQDPIESETSVCSAENSIDFYNYGSTGRYTVRITYKDCDRTGATTNLTCFKLESAKSVNIKFYTTTPSTVIKFYRNGPDDECAAFTTPKYVSGMPGTLTASISLQPGSYRIGVCSAEYSTVNGVIELYYVDKLDQ